MHAGIKFYDASPEGTRPPCIDSIFRILQVLRYERLIMPEARIAVQVLDDISSMYHSPVFAHVFNTLSKVWFLTAPPPIADRTLRLKPSLLDRKSSAASLFKGSDAFGSRKRNWIL